jgi:two-component SAPR family response regulator
MVDALRDLRRDDSADRLRSALARYRGEFLESESAGDWHLELRGHLNRLYVDGLLALSELLIRAERHAEAAEVCRQIVRADDLHEEAHRRIIVCLARAGDRVRAIRHYEQLVARLRDELGAEPDDETVELHDRLRQARAI